MSVPYLFVSADAEANTGEEWLEQQWETARLQRKSKGAQDFILAIDEIQKIQNWSEIVKRLWDEDRRSKQTIKVILLGSSRLLLQQGLTESLAGRFETTYIGHWSFTEMQEAFGSHLVNHQLSQEYTVHYWRDRNEEVDFVIERKGKVIGIEVKSGASRRNTSGMTAFKKQYKTDKVLLVGNSGIPWKEFLKMKVIDLF